MPKKNQNSSDKPVPATNPLATSVDQLAKHILGVGVWNIDTFEVAQHVKSVYAWRLENDIVNLMAQYRDYKVDFTTKTVLGETFVRVLGELEVLRERRKWQSDQAIIKANLRSLEMTLEAQMTLLAENIIGTVADITAAEAGYSVRERRDWKLSTGKFEDNPAGDLIDDFVKRARDFFIDIHTQLKRTAE